ncbi:MAG: phosphodiester glycosidase family protein [Fimbriimonas sp.]
MKGREWLVSLAIAALVVAAFAFLSRPAPRPIEKKRTVAEVPHPSAVWPWPDAERTALRPGVTRWYDRSPEDGTTLELIEFDFAANPRLRFELYDQDEDDATPHDDLADYYERSVGHVVRDLNAKGRGPVIAAWNGPFFAYDRRPGMGAHGMARHIGPVVLRGVPRHNVGNPRWTFGVQRGKFKVFHEASRETLQTEFDFAAAGVQCLIRNGKPLRLAPYPAPDAPLPRQPVPSTPEEAGHIPLVDHMRTSRTSIAWSKDSGKMYLIVVNEADHELGSKLAVKHGEMSQGGWTVSDLQRFWIAFGAPNAINSDGGAVTQFAYLRGDGKYEMLPPRLTSRNERLVFENGIGDAPKGGTLMTFYLREAK